MLSKKFFKTKSEAEVVFEFAREDVKSVQLAGDFNDWTPESMKFDKKTGSYKLKLRLPTDAEFQFKYLLNDAEWENDYAADAYIPNDQGTENSVISTKAA
ncbi:MAG TPA: isoamylase early set domain-containing protein [Pseudomonadales bacterium]|nr:isoamylase early set domain-containing protein [Pseudomonadales bacterium]